MTILNIQECKTNIFIRENVREPEKGALGFSILGSRVREFTDKSNSVIVSAEAKLDQDFGSTRTALNQIPTQDPHTVDMTKDPALLDIGTELLQTGAGHTSRVRA